MAHIWKDFVLETATTTGTGNFTLAGAVTGYRAFSAVCATNDTVYYFIQAIDGSGVPTGEWETGLGTYSASNTLTRTTVLDSSNAGAAVSFASGTKRVGLCSPATRSWDFGPPTAASFSLVSGDATNLTLTDDSNVGLMADAGSPVSGDKKRIAVCTLTDKTKDWVMVANIEDLTAYITTTNIGLFAYDSVGGKLVSCVATIQTGTTLFYEVCYWGSLTSFTSAPYNITLSRPARWFKIERSGSNLIYSISQNGKQWKGLGTAGVTAHLANAPDKVGFGVSYNRTTGGNALMTVPYFSLTGPAV